MATKPYWASCNYVRKTLLHTILSLDFIFFSCYHPFSKLFRAVYIASPSLFILIPTFYGKSGWDIVTGPENWAGTGTQISLVQHSNHWLSNIVAYPLPDQQVIFFSQTSMLGKCDNLSVSELTYTSEKWIFLPSQARWQSECSTLSQIAYIVGKKFSTEPTESTCIT